MVGITVFIVGSEYIVRTIVAPKSDFDTVRDQLHTTQAPYAAFADSHGARGLLDQSGFMNLSMGGDNLATILEKAQFFAKLTTTKGVVIQADPHHFASYRLNRDQSALRDDFFKRKVPWLTFLRPVYRQYLLEYWQAFLFSSPADIEATPAMIRLTDLAPAEVAKSVSIRAGLQTPIASFKQTKFAELYLKVIQSLHQDGIAVCLVSFPLASVYKKAIEREPIYSGVMQFYAALAKNVGVKYFDLSASLDDSQFADPDHLNTEGAAALTKIVLNDCFSISP